MLLIHLRLCLDFSIAKTLPPQTPRFGERPLLVARGLLGIDAEEVFDASSGQFSQGNLPTLTDLASSSVNFVRQLNLRSNHAYRMPSQQSVVNKQPRGARSWVQKFSGRRRRMCQSRLSFAGEFGGRGRAGTPEPGESPPSSSKNTTGPMAGGNWPPGCKTVQLFKPEGGATNTYHPIPESDAGKKQIQSG